MKNISISVLLIALLAVIGCSKEETSSNERKVTPSSFFQRDANSEISNFLNSFYKTDYSFGESVVTSDESKWYSVTEVIVKGESNARGYVVADKFTNKLLYFADVDRVNFTLKAYDFATNDIDSFQNINTMSEYRSTDGFNIVKMVKTANTNPSSRIGRFWGWSCGSEYSTGGSSCNRNCCYRVVWVQTSCDVFTCSNLPGSNPALP